MFWKIYFWFIAIIYASILVFEINTGKLNVLRTTDFLFSVFGLLALYGYAYKKRFFQPLVWKLYFPFIIVWDIGCTVLTISQTHNQYSVFLNTVSYLLIILFMLPLYIGLFKYAYRYKEENAESIISPNDIPEQIKKLAELKDLGVLTEEEFSEKKRELLRRM